MLRSHELSTAQKVGILITMATNMKFTPFSEISKSAKLQERAWDSIINGTQWMTLEQLALTSGLGAHPEAKPSQRQIVAECFSIQKDGHDLYPRYAFGDDFRPLPAMAEIMKTFQGWDAMRMAGWFESTSSYLQGRRPRELIESDPDLVVSAVKDAVKHLSHG
jgi:hypothetical protein